MFRGLELVPPGLVRTSRWRPAEESTAEFSDLFGGVGRKP
ncbi:MAG TPA: SAM-dependent methyltransferase [Streptosporangiaceae bacterium]